MLDKGKIIEVGPVQELREMEGGVFGGMLDGKDTGMVDKGKALFN